VLTILTDDKQITIDGRIAAIVRWLLKQRRRIEALDKMEMTFYCAGPKVSAEMVEREQLDAALLR